EPGPSFFAVGLGRSAGGAAPSQTGVEPERRAAPPSCSGAFGSQLRSGQVSRGFARASTRPSSRPADRARKPARRQLPRDQPGNAPSPVGHPDRHRSIPGPELPPPANTNLFATAYAAPQPVMLFRRREFQFVRERYGRETRKVSKSG